MKPSKQDIEKGLADIRKRRKIYLFILFSFLPILVIVMSYIEKTDIWYPIILPVALFFFGMFIQNRLHKSKCPRCHEFFFVQTVTRENYTPLSSTSFPPQKKCQNCSLVLYN